MTDKVRMKLMVEVEFDADPAHYPDPTPEGMAKVTQEQMSDLYTFSETFANDDSVVVRAFPVQE